MTSVPTIAPSDLPNAAQDAPRLRLRPPGAITGHVDGGWWPRSRDLAVELPGVLAALASRTHPVGRVSYNPADWEPAPHRVVADGRAVRLGWYRLMPTGTVDVVSGPQRITLVVVPPDTAAADADVVLTRAGDPRNVDAAATLLAAIPSGDLA